VQDNADKIVSEEDSGTWSPLITTRRWGVYPISIYCDDLIAKPLDSYHPHCCSIPLIGLVGQFRCLPIGMYPHASCRPIEKMAAVSRAQTEGSLATDIPFPRLPEELSVAIKISLPARQRARLSLDSQCRHSNWPVVYSCALLPGFSDKKVPDFHLAYREFNAVC
jgi:hypothetical protein